MRTYVLSVLCILGLLLASCDGFWTAKEAAGERKQRAVWVYTLEEQPQDQLLRSINRAGFNTVYLSVAANALVNPASTAYAELVRSFALAAKTHNIEVHLMICEQPDYTFAHKHALAIQEFQAVLAFLQRYPDTPIRGIQLDVEPQALPEWPQEADPDDATREALVSAWLDLHRKIAEIARPSGLQFSTAMTWWYDALYREGRLPSGNPALLAEHIDFAVIMAYATVLTPWVQAQDEMAVMPVVVAVESANFSSRNRVQQMGMDMHELGMEQRNYLGYAVFELGSYWNLGW